MTGWQTREFIAYYGGLIGYSAASLMNKWLEDISKDGTHEYDLKFITAIPASAGDVARLVVTYEVTELVSRFLPCGVVCDTCGTSAHMSHTCSECDVPQ